MPVEQAIARAFVDTNVLLTATDASRRSHHAATDALETWPRTGTTLYVSGQILREYLVVATRPVAQNGLGLPRHTALSNTDALATRVTILPEDLRVHQRLRDLLEAIDCSGKRIHDANVVATMLVHGIGTLVTLNDGDFTRFGSVIDVLAPSTEN